MVVVQQKTWSLLLDLYKGQTNLNFVIKNYLNL